VRACFLAWLHDAIDESQGQRRHHKRQVQQHLPFDGLGVERIGLDEGRKQVNRRNADDVRSSQIRATDGIPLRVLIQAQARTWRHGCVTRASTAPDGHLDVYSKSCSTAPELRSRAIRSPGRSHATQKNSCFLGIFSAEIFKTRKDKRLPGWEGV
jgi:hypothetical protein